MSETFYIKKTAFDDAGSSPADNAQRDENSFIIGPGELNGPAGLNRDSDLELYGFGALKWGEGVDQNQYRQLENFACPQKENGDYWAAGSPPEGAYLSGTHPVAPKDENDLGIGNGITEPLNGQSWYNTTDKTLYTFGSGSPATEWRSDMTATNVLDMNGFGIVNTLDPTDAATTLPGGILAPQDVVTVGWADTRFVNVTGDSMTGTLDLGSNQIISLADPTDSPTTLQGGITQPNDAVNVGWADDRWVNITGDTMTGILDMGSNTISNLGNANSGDDAVSRDYSDARYVAKEDNSTVNNSGNYILQVKNTDAAQGYFGTTGGLSIHQDTSGRDAFINFNEAGSAFNFGRDGATNDLFVGGGSMGTTKYKVWHAGNDGPGSGLNADYFDGYNSSSYLKTWDGYQKSDITYPSYVWSRTTYNTGANIYKTDTIPLAPGRPSWANYVKLRFEWSCYNGNLQDLRWAHASLNGYTVIGLGADDTDQGYVSAPLVVSEVWVSYYHRSLRWTVYHGGGGANQKLTIRRVGWHA